MPENTTVNDEGRPVTEPARIEEEHEDARLNSTSTQVDGPGRDLTQDHADFLAQYMDLDQVNGSIRSALTPADLPAEADSWWSKKLPAKLYRWSQNGRTVWQLAPDDRSDGPKYAFPEGSEPPLNQVRDDGGQGAVIIVEGSKQQWTAASYLDPALAIYGMFGCWGWSGRDLTFAADRLVYVILDADLATNRDVWNAAQALRDHLIKTVKAAGVRFATVPGAGSTGLDDWLATVEREDRAEALATLLDNASPDLPKAPAPKKAKKNPRYFSESGGLLAWDVAKALHQALPMALTAENQVAVYRHGVYRTSSLALITALAQMLKNDYRRGYLATVEDVLSGILEHAGRVLPERLDRPWLNTLDGMVDLETGELHEHDPDLLSAVQFPVHYDPAATCPTFDRWAEDIGITDQLPALLEAASVMLDPTTIPQKALLLFGPARSGKSTFLRLLEALAGHENRSGVSLHELADDQFAAANVYGKVLNVSADLSARHLQDVTRFKLMTGEDVVRGNRKYGRDFFFRSTALFAFSANEIPTVGESSRAYVERMQPFEFGHSFAGRVDRSIEPAMLQELPGILNRLIRAWQERKARGHDLDADPVVRQKFEQASDRVALWMAEEMRIVSRVTTRKDAKDPLRAIKPVAPGMTLAADMALTRDELYESFTEWAVENGARISMGKSKLMQRIQSMPGVVEVRIGRSKVRGFNIRRRKEDEPDPAVAKVAEVAPVGKTSNQVGAISKSNQSKVSVTGATTATTATDPPGRPDPVSCPRCGGTTLYDPTVSDRRVCVSGTRVKGHPCQWSRKEPGSETWDGAEGLFEKAARS